MFQFQVLQRGNRGPGRLGVTQGHGETRQPRSPEPQAVVYPMLCTVDSEKEAGWSHFRAETLRLSGAERPAGHRTGPGGPSTLFCPVSRAPAPSAHLRCVGTGLCVHIPCISAGSCEPRADKWGWNHRRRVFPAQTPSARDPPDLTHLQPSPGNTPISAAHQLWNIRTERPL